MALTHRIAPRHAEGAAFAALRRAAGPATTICLTADELRDGWWAVDGGEAAEAGALLVLVRDPGRELGVPDPHDPLVRRADLTAVTVDGRRLRLRDVVEVPLTVADWELAPLAGLDGRVVAASGRDRSGRRITLLGAPSVLEDRWLVSADNASVVWEALTGRQDGNGVAAARAARPTGPVPNTDIPVLHGRWSDAVAAPPRDLAPDDPEFVRAAGHAARLLDPEVHDRLVDFTDDPGPAGALLLRGVPVGCLPATPPRPTDPVVKDRVSERVLLTVARRLGQPVGYAPEHSGSLVQNLVPTLDDIGRQTSTSSGVELAFHTETAFHPHRPRFLLLLCLRGDPGAATTLCSVDDALHHLSARSRQLLHEPRYRTRVDRSFRPTDPERTGRPRPVLRGPEDRPTWCWDADLMEATTPEAADALDELAESVSAHHRSLVLESGDLLVVDNTRCVHGRSPFTARFDGTDRWLQRTFVVADLVPSDAERSGRVLTTRFDL